METSAGAAARAFHDRTKYLVVDTGAGASDIRMGAGAEEGPALGEQSPELEPSPFKIYLDLESVPLPATPLVTDVAALEAIAASGETGEAAREVDLDLLGRLLFRTAGLLKEWVSPWGKSMHFRASGCTGARYHLEFYAVVGAMDDLDAGVYHYDPQSHGLQQIRAGDLRQQVVEACGEHQSAADAQVFLICSSEFWRNAWRYQERSWRHAFWDLGTHATNLLALCASEHLAATVLMGFVDEQINALIRIDGEQEAALGVFAIGQGGVADAQLAEVLPAVDHRVAPSSPRTIDFPAIQVAHRASSFPTGEEVSAWQSTPLERTLDPVEGRVISLSPVSSPDENVEQVILRRRSNRHYATDVPMAFDQFSAVIETAMAPARIDALDSRSPGLSDLYLIVNRVDGLESGSYLYRPDLRGIELLQAGRFDADAVRLACGQSYAGDAHVAAFWLADLDAALQQYGDRGYRLAQFEAALAGGRLQLAAHALGLGAVGSTSPDDDVAAFFSPTATGKDFLFVAVFGVRRKPTDAETSAASTFLNRDQA